jgi:uncharacterized sulfatase
MFATPIWADELTRPNIVWLVNEDHGPQLGCYGDALATTPHADRLASMGFRYTRAWSCASVCAPARTTIITGLYASSLGAGHMRSMVPCPAEMKLFPQLLSEAGYYCTNNHKEDYNVAALGKVWDESSIRAHWRSRKPGQPFFAVFNSEKSHESKIRTRPHKAFHDPARVKVPAYHPDTPEVRQDWAQYYDGVTNADADAGRRLKELEDAGLLEETIVFYYADHGSGMPRNKRWLYTSGLHVPLIIYIPEKYRSLRPADYQPNGTADRLVSFVDLAPTVLSLASIQPPAWMQGRAFLGPFAGESRQFVFGFRGRMDEKIDLSRGVFDGQYLYIRNYLPHRPQGQHLAYMFQTPTTHVWRKMFDEGRLTPAQAFFWNSKPAEELYDVRSDPDQIRNLAQNSDLDETLARLRTAQQEWCRSIRDVGFLPEGDMHRRTQGRSPRDLTEGEYPYDRVFRAADQAASFDQESRNSLIQDLADADPAVRYWGATGLLIRGGPAVVAAQAELTRSMNESAPEVALVAAEALVRYGPKEGRQKAMARLIELADCRRQDVFTVIAALNSLCAIELPNTPRDTIGQSSRRCEVPHPRYAEYAGRLVKELAADLP